MAQTEIKQINEKDISNILGGNFESVITPEVKDKDKNPEGEDKKEVKEPDSGKFKKVVNTDFNWSDLRKIAEEDKLEDEEEKIEVPEEDKKIESNTSTEKKAGRKPTDLVVLVNQMVEEGELVGFEDGEVKTIEEAKDLIKLNRKKEKETSEEDFWKEKLGSYSPQVQAIIQYAESGGTDIYPLLSAIAEAERTSDFNIESSDGQEEVVKEYLKLQGWDDVDIKDEIDTAKDLDKLKTKAEKFLPKLNQMKEERIQMIMAQQEQRKAEAAEARRNYLGKIKNTLDKEKLGDIKLQRQDKAMIWNALTDVNHTSLSGHPTNAFFKRIEDLQIGETADYDHFMEIVHLAMDRGGFKKKFLEQATTATAAETARKLKIQEKKIPNSPEGFDEEEPVRKDKIQRQTFKNPWG